MKRIDPSILVGAALIVLGGLFVLQNMGVLNDVGDIFWGVAFLAAGAFFLVSYFGGAWWAAIPGCVLVGIGALILLPDSLDRFGGALFLGGIGLAFWLAYFPARQERWWALIPAGVLTTLAFITFLPELAGDKFTPGFFFLGLALTFALVALLAGMRWAWYPAAALGGMGFLFLVALGSLANYIWAAALIAAGLFLVFRYFRPA
ncbi:MAG: hypothetical protein HFACDABA_01143 [Anaerolineales bacterium]|nr:hypothetical protein [Anaerolineales bacterium]